MDHITLKDIDDRMDGLFDRLNVIEDMVENIEYLLGKMDISILEELTTKIDKSCEEIDKRMDEANEKFFESVTRNTTKLTTMINEYKGFIAIERARTAKFNAAIRETVEKLSEE
jgi:hypothetical protein